MENKIRAINHQPTKKNPAIKLGSLSIKHLT